jgi:hypothetical protein
MNFLKFYWKPIATLLIGLIIFTAGYSRGYSHEKAVYDAYRYQSEALAHVAQAHTTDVVNKQVEITNNVTKEYANAVDKLKIYYANHRPVKWLHDTLPSSGKVSDLSDTSSASDGNTTGIKLGADGASPLDCAADVMQLLSLQKWIKEQEGNK